MNNINPPKELYKTRLGSEGDIKDKSVSNLQIGVEDALGFDEPPPASHEINLGSDGDMKDRPLFGSLEIDDPRSFQKGDRNKETIAIQELTLF